MKVGIVGCGNIAEVHIPFILNQENVEIVGIADIKRERARHLAEKYHIDDYYSNVDEMLDEKKPDVVHVLTSVQTHAEMVIKSIKAGCHVFVEKAMCVSDQEVNDIITTAQENGRKICVDHILIFEPLIIRAKELISSGLIGEMVHIEALICDDHLQKLREGLARPWVDGVPGGIFNELLPHPLCVAMYFLPDMAFESAGITKAQDGTVEELLCFFSGGKGSSVIRISLAERPIQQVITFHGTRGVICVDYRNLTLTIKKESRLPGPVQRLYSNVSMGSQIFSETIKTAWGVARGRIGAYSGLKYLIDEFYNSIRTNGDSPISEHDGGKVVRMMNAVWKVVDTQRRHENSPAIPLGFYAKKRRILETNGNDANILITGGTGFLGSYLARRLIAEGNTVRLLVRRSSDLSRLPDKNIEIVYGDLRDPDSIRSCTAGIEMIYHCAVVSRGRWMNYYEGTVEGTRNLLDIAIENEVKKVVYISSTGIFNTAGFSDATIIDEDSDLEKNPDKRGFYVKAKLEAEKIVKEYMNNEKLRVSIIRPGIIYGEGGRTYVSDAGYLLKNKFIVVPGKGKRPLHLIYVENLVDAITLAGESAESDGKVFNIVDRDQPTVRQYLKKYKKITGKKPVIVYVPRIFFKLSFWSMRKAFRLIPGFIFPDMSYKLRSLTHNRYDIGQAESVLQWTSRISLEEALKKTFRSEIGG